MKWIASALFLFASLLSGAQPTTGLAGYFAFDDCTADESQGNAAIISVINGAPSCECGVRGNAFRFDGNDDYVFFTGPINSEFDAQDFTLSFYFKPTGVSGTQTLVSKGADCSDQNFFAVRYDPNTRLLNVQLIESPGKSASISRYQLPGEACWHHIIVMRKNTQTMLYVNGELVAESRAMTRVNIRNNEVLHIAKSACGTTDRNFEGLLDEIRLYNRALQPSEIESLYFRMDQILTDDTRIFLGESVQVGISNTCEAQFGWSPADGVADPTDPNTTLSPTQTTTYRLTFMENGCPGFASDTIRIVVIDPKTISCEEVFLPNAFTPNDDNLNDTYGISNPEIFTFGGAELLGFEIFDRWGNMVFETVDANDRWDGRYKDEPLNPGVLLYRVKYRCNGEENIKSGSLTIIR